MIIPPQTSPAAAPYGHTAQYRRLEKDGDSQRIECPGKRLTVDPLSVILKKSSTASITMIGFKGQGFENDSDFRSAPFLKMARRG